jgi:ubiquinone/menaquinone biosynthesis C-methylase UbiE
MDNNKKIKYQVDKNHYFTSSYDTKERFISYWHQIHEAMILKPTNLLEIGIGNGLVSNYLKKNGVNITTLDIDKRLKPDVVGSVLQPPFVENYFDVVACYELFEHLTYNNFKKALREIYRISKMSAIISLPDVTTVYRINIELPRSKPIKKLIPHPFPRPALQKLHNEHYWEIGKKNFPLKKILKDMRETGFTILKTYRIFEFYYHRFIILKK